MKKFLSILLTLAMMLSLVIVATLPTAAIDGDWIAIAQAKQQNEEIGEDEYSSVAGYEYDSEGFHLTAANWAGHTPWARFVSKNKIDLKEGVYMEIRIDEFNYSASLDSWFNVMLWDQQVMTPGDPNYGTGLQNLIRPGIQNTTYWFTGPFTQLNPKTWSDVPQDIDDNGKHNLTVVIAWDEANSTFTYTINGVSAADAAIAYMNEKWGGDESEAYVGFAFQHNSKGESISCTLTKFGTSADDASVPAGDDYANPIDYSTNYVTAPVVENPTFEAGQPGIFMNGNLDSNIKNLPGSASGETITFNEDGTVKIVAGNSSSATGTWVVENATSYAVEDLPIIMMVTKNFCTCGEEDQIDGRCGAYETSNVYLMTGDHLSADNGCMASASVSWDAYYIGDDGYLCIMLDASEISAFTGRINAVRFDLTNIDTATPGANTFDICFIACFATEEDANAYFENYLTSLGWENPDEETTTEEPEETTTEAPETTKAPETTVAPETNKPEGTTAAPSDDKGDKTEGGCGSVVGFGAIAIVAVASVAGFVSFKKKED